MIENINTYVIIIIITYYYIVIIIYHFNNKAIPIVKNKVDKRVNIPWIKIFFILYR